jgi:gluconokinase
MGTTSAKAMVVSEEGRIIFSSQEFYPTMFPRPGYAEQDPEIIYLAVAKIIGDCCRESGDIIKAVCFSSAMHSMMAVDRNGRPLTNLLLWSDMRSTAQAQRIREHEQDSRIYFETGTPVHPMSPLSKLIWLKENEPEIFTKAFKFISAKEYVFSRLCNRYVVDYSVASASGLLDVQQLKWSSHALRLANIDASKLSECVSPYEQVGTPCDDAIREMGIGKHVIVIAGANDGCLAHLGSGSTETGHVSLTIGTSGAVRMASSTMAHDPKKRIFNYRLDEKTFITGGATNNGTVVLDWFAKNVAQGERLSPDEFGKVASTIPAGAEGLLFLPFVFGERAPWYNADFRGTWLGLAQHHTRQHMMRSVLEGICFEIRSIVESLEEAVAPIKSINASGGFIRSRHWLQLLSDILQKEIILSDVHDASSLGAAIMGFRAIGHEVSFRDLSPDQLFKPNHATAQIYHELFGLFGSTTMSLQSGFHTIAALQGKRT